jgi:c-di-GMP-binding flagellar brake protein YcgR
MSPSSLQRRIRTHRVLHSVAWPGELTWGEDGLRFVAEDADAPGAAALDVPLADVIEARHNAREGLLVIELGGDERARFVGQGLEPVHAALAASLADLATRTHGGRSDPEAEEHSVSLRSGPIIHRGGLHLDPEALTYTPRSLLDTLVGVRQQRVEWSAVRSLTALGGPHGLVDIGHAGGRLVLQPAAPDAVFEALLQRVHRHQVTEHGDEQTRAARVAASLAAWPGAEAPGAGASTTLALHGSADHSFRVGVVVVEGDQLRFLPEDGRGAPITLGLQALVRRSGRSRGLPMVRVAVGDTQHSFLLATGRPGAQAFWAALRAPSRVIPWDELGPRTRTRLAEEARFLRITVGDEDAVDVAPLAVYAGPDAWTLVTPGALPGPPARGQQVHVEIGQDEGVYAFDATVSAHRQRAAGEDGPAETTLELQSLGAVRVFNQRQGYRVGVRLAASARAIDADSGLPPGERVALSVHDLSIGGCRVQAEATLPVNAVLDIAIELPGWTVRAHARVLRAEPSDAAASLPYGLRFERIGAADEDRVHRFVLQQQRGDLQVPPTDEPSLPEHAFR